MQPVQGGWTSHKTRGDGDYEALKRAAIAQSGQNEFTQGIQSVFETGVGQSIKDSRSKYGNVNIMPQQVNEGVTSNFQQGESSGNMPLEDPVNSTGSVSLEQSATRTTQQDPQEFETSALEARLANMDKGGMHNLNNIPNLYGRGG